MPDTLLQIKAEQADLIQQNKKLLDTADAEGRELTPQEQLTFDEAKAKFERLGARYDVEKQSLEFSIDQQRDDDARDANRVITFSEGEMDLETANEWLKHWLRGTDGNGNAMPNRFEIDIQKFMADGLHPDAGHQLQADRHKKFALTIGTNSQGGFTGEDILGEQIVYRRITYSAMERTNSRAWNTADGSEADWPVVDDTANVALRQDEANAPTGSDADPAFAQKSIPTHAYSTRTVQLSEQLIRDSKFNMVAEVGNLLGRRIGQTLNSQFSVGDGTGDPTGILTALDGNSGRWEVELSASARTAAHLEHIRALVGGEQYVDESYHDNAFYMMHPALWYGITALAQGTTNARLLRSDWADGVPRRLNGYPVIFNRAFEATPFAASSNNDLAATFGSFEHYIRRFVGNMVIRRIDQDATYIENRLVGLVGQQDIGGNFVHPDLAAAISAANPGPVVAFRVNSA